VIEVDGDERLDSAGTVVLVGACVDAAMIPMGNGDFTFCFDMTDLIEPLHLWHS